MTLRHLKIFIAVCDYKSTVEAARQLHIAQPSISFAIKEIEEHYSIKLFDRISRKMILTEEGKSFLYQARDIINKMQSLETSILDSDAKKTITIGSSSTISIFLLPPIIKKFKTLNSNIHINLIIRDSKTLSQLILKNEIDIALIETQISHKDIISTPFYNDSLLLYISKQNVLSQKEEITLKDLKKENIILREKHSAVRTLVDSVFLNNNLDTNITWESSSTQAIISLVENNLGISILPSLWKDSLKLNTNIITKQINDVSIKRDYQIIHHKNKYISSNIRNLIDIILNQ